MAGPVWSWRFGNRRRVSHRSPPRWTTPAISFNRSVFLLGYMRQTFTKCGQVLGFVALGLCLSCSRRTSVQESVLAGTWQRVDKPAITMTFLRGGTFSANVGGEHLLGGKYRLLNGDQMALDLDASSPKPGSVTNGAFMLGKELRIKPAGGEAERYKRVEQQPQ